MINAIKDISGALRSYSLGLDPGNDARDLAESKEALSTTETRPTEVEARCASLRSELKVVQQKRDNARNDLQASRMVTQSIKHELETSRGEVAKLQAELRTVRANQTDMLAREPPATAKVHPPSEYETAFHDLMTVMRAQHRLTHQASPKEDVRCVKKALGLHKTLEEMRNTADGTAIRMALCKYISRSS